MLAAISVFDADQNITLGRAAEPGADYSASSAGATLPSLVRAMAAMPRAIVS